MKESKVPFFLNHRLFFFAGWLFYIFMPIVLGYASTNDSSEIFNFFVDYFDVQNEYWIYFLFYSLGSLLAYCFGSLLCSSAKKRNCRSCVDKSSASAIVYWLAVAYLVLLLALTWEARLLLGVGYKDGVDISLIGPLCTLEMLLLFHVLYEQFVGSRQTIRIYSVILVFCSFVLLSLGARLAVLSAIVSIYFQWWNWGAANRRVQIRSLKFIASVPIILSVVGMWRQGDMGFDIAKFLYYFFGEPIGVAISAVTIFTNGQWVGLVDFRGEFWINFYNMIPSFVWPDKAEFISEGVGFMADKFEQPFGATSIIASSIGYFGFVGGLVFFGLVGAFMAVMGCSSNIRHQTYYCFLIGLLPFLFFRDPFQVQFKYVVTGALMSYLMKWLRPVSRQCNNAKIN